MKRRVICVLLSALILMSLLPAMALPTLAASEMKTSDDCVDILKEMEGFIKYPVYDNGQYTVGYGSGCGKGEYPDGITEEEAEELLREYLADMEKSLNYFADRYNLKFTQNQFDALMLFTYNCGANWVGSDGEFRQAVINGATGNDFIYPFCLWSNASGKLNEALVKRRLIEADMYLNGSYTNKRPVNYTYVIFEHNGGISDVKVQGYDANLNTLVKPIPTLSGSRFLGWYTEAEGGSWVTKLTAANGGSTVYAHWQTGSGDMANGTAASYQRTSDQLASLSVYEAPGGKVSGTLTAGDTVKIVADYVDGSNQKWGKLDKGGWVNLGNPLVGVVSSGSSQDPVEVTVTGTGVNVRSGPGTTYGIIGSVTKGNKLTITETKMNGTMLWGKFAAGWVCLQYTNYSEVNKDTETDKEPDKEPDKETDTDKEEPAAVIATGTVDCTALLIRSGPGTNYPMVGSLKNGDRVQITQKKTVGGMTWGKIASGWICLNYVKLDSASSEPEKEETPDKPGTETTPDTSNKVTGTVSSNTGLNVRSGPGTHNAIVGGYNPGDKVEILEQKDYNGETWGRTDKGWICMRYVKLDTTEESDGDTTGGTTGGENTGGTGGTTGVNGTVISKTGLNIRSGPGTNYASVGSYTTGSKIVVLEKKTVNGVAWGKTDKGWVCLTYVKLDDTVPETGTTTPGTEQKPETETKPETGSGVNGTVISNTPLNIRSAPGTHNAQVGTYNKGSRITILEQTTLNGVAWGKTDRGWVCMKYVQLDSDANAAYTATVTASSLCIRDKAGTDSNVLGYYKNGDKVEILETTYVHGVAWGRTAKGWVCLAYVQK